ncbi:DUF6468 domain-containing protein [Methylopila turkensis]|uniref:DUF6468 domain-containing protein n=1 Tax=Methylopila turkensis TaxID=1437816 RepID=A0A9W6N6K7_9HYPH|nr:DUF6468 domain-containing protein [Methylopila turkensis]GLK79421.1 hypothetical protein GCM10008174_11620 [Methylopila turkensis]
MQNVVGLAIESLVAILLVATIAYCAVLNRRLSRLRADEGVMRETITELVAATHGAERAIVALRSTLGVCEETLAERLARAEQVSGAISQQLTHGEQVIEQIAKIARAAREHASQEVVRAEAARRDHEREAARLAARAEAEAVAELRREADREPASQRRRAIPAPSPLGRSAATAAAAEMFASRVRALSSGAPA